MPLRLSAAALSLALFATAASAGEPVRPAGVTVAFGNTVKALYPDGRYQWLWFNADGTWEAFGRRGKWSSGKWSQRDGSHVCLKQSRPIPIPLNYCTAFPAGSGVGAVWTSKSLEGEPIKVTVVKGIQRPATTAGAAR
jgi:hypothetical protein